jgi:hypothetical protein
VVKRAFFAAAVLLMAASAAAEPPLCRARLLLEPSEAFVGQPVLHRVLIERRRDVVDLRWETNPSFPAFRAEWIPSRTGPGSSEGTTLLDERHVLFPGRAGTLSLPGAKLVCESADRLERVALAAADLVVREPPEAGRPPGWQGLIGPVQAHLRVTPDRVALGESAAVSVVVKGETNVWAAPMPLVGAFAEDEAELFDRPVELARDSGLGLVLRRYFAFDLVPQAGAPAAGGRPDAQTDPQGSWWMLAMVAGLLVAAALFLWRRFSHGGDGDSAPSRAGLRHALASGEPEEAAAVAARALREAIEEALPGDGVPDRPVEELAAEAGQPEVREDAALLAQLDAARFGGADAERLLALAREAELRLRGR